MSFKQFLKEEPDAKGVAAEILRAFTKRGCDQQGPEVEGDGSVYVGVRDWGHWEHDQGNEDEEDDDHEVLSRESSRELRAIVADLQTKYPKFNIRCNTGEKNWIEFNVKAKA